MIGVVRRYVRFGEAVRLRSTSSMGAKRTFLSSLAMSPWRPQPTSGTATTAPPHGKHGIRALRRVRPLSPLPAGLPRRRASRRPDLAKPEGFEKKTLSSDEGFAFASRARRRSPPKRRNVAAGDDPERPRRAPQSEQQQWPSELPNFGYPAILATGAFPLGSSERHRKGRQEFAEAAFASSSYAKPLILQTTSSGEALTVLDVA